jgi:hypothetical protein
MTPQQLEHLASRHAVLVSTVLYLPHPKDGYQSWRRKWRRSPTWSTTQRRISVTHSGTYERNAPPITFP